MSDRLLVTPKINLTHYEDGSWELKDDSFVGHFRKLHVVPGLNAQTGAPEFQVLGEIYWEHNRDFTLPTRIPMHEPSGTEGKEGYDDGFVEVGLLCELNGLSWLEFAGGDGIEEDSDSEESNEEDEDSKEDDMSYI